jgi:hypothetical protein
LLRDLAISAALLAVGFLMGAGFAEWRAAPTRLDRTEDLAAIISESNPGMTVVLEDVSTSGPMIYVTLPPASPGEQVRPVGRIEIGHDGEILPSLHDSEEGFIAYHWNRSMTEEELLESIDRIEDEYEQGP